MFRVTVPERRRRRNSSVIAARRLAVGTIASIVVLGSVVAGCGQDEYVRPPDPEFVWGQAAPAASSTPPDTELGTLDEGDEESPDGETEDTTPPTVNVDSLVETDDAGKVIDNNLAWKTFDESLGSQLSANSAASVAVMVNGELVHSAAFGARLPGTDEATKTTDRFRIASISKSITAIVVMQLVEAGQLGIDEPVGRRVADYLGVAQIDPNADGITVRQLLSHTSGFPKHYSTFFSNRVATCADAARIGLGSGVSGSRSYRYSNMNYCVLGILIEAVTGKAYERVVQEQLLTPLGISGMRLTTTFEIAPDEVSHFPAAGRNYMESLGAAGQWNATPSDLVLIFNAINPATPGWKALEPQGMAALRSRVPTTGEPAGYGLGLINYGGGTWGHTGTIEHTHAMVFEQPDGVSWAVTVAGDSPSNTGQLRNVVANAFRSAF